jgi:hypothetical protein
MDRSRRNWFAVLGACGLLGAVVAAGCGAAGVGLGSLGIALVAGIVWLALAASSSTGCSSRGPVGACLSIAPPQDAGAAEAEPVEPPGPCLQPYVGPCLEYPGPCLSEPAPDDVCLLITPFCLSPDYHSMDAGEPPDAGPPPAPCLSIAPPHPCLRAPATAPRGEKTSARPAATDAGERLAAAGVLTPEQLHRLARLRGDS